VSPWFSDALLRTQTDERLVALARDGHERAFVAIVERYRRPLLGFTSALVPAGRAEDVLQQAFLNAWAALGRGAEVRHLRGWLHQIVRHAAMASRTPGEDPLPDTMIDRRDTPGHVEERLLIAQTLENLAALPDHQREAIVKTAMEGRSREEVASSLGVTEGAVRAMLHRARTTLRAAATAVTPLPLAVWAASAAERGADIAAGGGAAGLAAAAAKAGTVVAVTGAVATTVAGDRLSLVHRHRTPTQGPTAQLREATEVAPVVHRAPTSAPVRAARAPRPAARRVTVAARPAPRAVVRRAPTSAGSAPHRAASRTSPVEQDGHGDDEPKTTRASGQPAKAEHNDDADHAVVANVEHDDSSGDGHDQADVAGERDVPRAAPQEDDASEE
jgi:RNA polymerase sigma factor (sigma-70 family)